MERCKSIVIQLLAEKRQCQKLRSCKQFSWSRQGDAAASAAAAAAAASCSSCCRSTGRRDQSPAAPALKNVQMIILTLVTSLATPFASVTATVHLLLAITETRGGGFIETTLRVRAGESHSPLRNFSHQIKSKIEFNSTPLTVGDCVLLVTVGPRISRMCADYVLDGWFSKRRVRVLCTSSSELTSMWRMLSLGGGRARDAGASIRC